ncbi:MAG: hypothetical protein P4M12_03090 [Gammaproteobacteria bacterium]|nr:hypothetical protein [Gammaproteobacteria bacterium]
MMSSHRVVEQKDLIDTENYNKKMNQELIAWNRFFQGENYFYGSQSSDGQRISLSELVHYAAQQFKGTVEANYDAERFLNHVENFIGLRNLRYAGSNYFIRYVLESYSDYYSGLSDAPKLVPFHAVSYLDEDSSLMRLSKQKIEFLDERKLTPDSTLLEGIYKKIYPTLTRDQKIQWNNEVESTLPKTEERKKLFAIAAENKPKLSLWEKIKDKALSFKELSRWKKALIIAGVVVGGFAIAVGTGGVGLGVVLTSWIGLGVAVGGGAVIAGTATLGLMTTGDSRIYDPIAEPIISNKQNENIERASTHAINSHLGIPTGNVNYSDELSSTPVVNGLANDLTEKLIDNYEQVPGATVASPSPNF